MKAQLKPCAGATSGSRCPKTTLTSDGTALDVTDEATGHSIRLTPASLYQYKCPQSAKNSAVVHGLAALDEDGLVLLDLPGEWYAPHLRDFAAASRIPLYDARQQRPSHVRAMLAARAPGWQRIRGLPAPSLATWRKPVSICLGVAGIGLMAYLASTGMWVFWRGLATLGRVLIDLIDAKWLLMMFSPALLLLRPAWAKLHRRRVARGTAIGPITGPNLKVRGRSLLVTHGKEELNELPIGQHPGAASNLLLYQHEDRSGLVVFDNAHHPCHHLPGTWNPDDVNRFADRHGLELAVLRLTRQEYLNLTRACREATP
ncbi:hypothetical protein HII36_36890 [Nonomuraea sp. NN258]|uniref:hypothetical protein n=1 Tax=Nonomuraea antri TaxID=2730852 RepID=UPI001567CE92|nr:hypothetical protein [Nonomuraea antri]NRQ37374.1 hypothetical protein [Nonomuraea antri]